MADGGSYKYLDWAAVLQARDVRTPLDLPACVGVPLPLALGEQEGSPSFSQLESLD